MSGLPELTRSVRSGVSGTPLQQPCTVYHYQNVSPKSSTIKQRIEYIRGRLWSDNGPSGKVRNDGYVQIRMLLDRERQQLTQKIRIVREELDQQAQSDVSQQQLQEVNQLEQNLDKLKQERFNGIGERFNGVLRSVEQATKDANTMILKVYTNSQKGEVRASIQDLFKKIQDTLESIGEDLEKEEAIACLKDRFGRTAAELFKGVQDGLSKRLSELLDRLASKISSQSEPHGGQGGVLDQPQDSPILPDTRGKNVSSDVPFAQPGGASDDPNLPTASPAVDHGFDPDVKQTPNITNTHLREPDEYRGDDWGVELSEGEVAVAIACTLVALAILTLCKRSGRTLPLSPDFKIKPQIVVY